MKNSVRQKRLPKKNEELEKFQIFETIFIYKQMESPTFVSH